MLIVVLVQSNFSPYVHVKATNNQSYNGILKTRSLNLWREQIFCTYKSCRWSMGEPSFLRQDVYAVNFLCTSLHSILAKSKSKVILISQTETFIKLSVKLGLEIKNENWKTKIKQMGWTFLYLSLPLSPWFFENWSNLWSKTGIWQHLSYRKSCRCFAASLVLFWISLSIWIDTAESLGGMLTLKLRRQGLHGMQQKGRDLSVCYLTMNISVPIKLLFLRKKYSLAKSTRKLIYHL